MHTWWVWTLAWGLALGGIAELVGDEAIQEIRLGPSEIRLEGASDRQRVIVSGQRGRYAVDLTDTAELHFAEPGIAALDGHGVLRPLADGTTQLLVQVAGQRLTATVVVEAAQRHAPPTFEHAIQPILTAGGCNMGACHGKQGGQNGFALSLLGFDDDYDFAAIAAQSRGRRVFPAAPEWSLLLRKAVASEPHGGGRRFEPDSPEYATLERWIAAGLPRDDAETPLLESISMWPPTLVLPAETSHRLVVLAHYSDGSTRDVTALAGFQSNESAVVAVDGGLVTTGPLPGEATIMARYRDELATTGVLVPRAEAVAPEVYAALPENNVIDAHVWRKLEVLGLEPSERCDDHEFLRRVFIDIIGRLPSSDEARAFLDDGSPDKRARLVDELLERPEYADYWANKWADLLRPNPYRVGIKATLTYDQWIRDAFRRNQPYDEFVRELVTAQGSTWRQGNAVFFRERRTPDELATMVSQLFLGIRLECAKCHHHPSEVWSQEDFYHFAAFFERVDRKGQGVSPPISGGEEFIFTGRRQPVEHPQTGQEMEPRPLFGEISGLDEVDDPRKALADWMTNAGNPYFPRVMANRVWADLLGRGIVEPVDDLRLTNPPTNEPLLAALADEFRASGYDVKHLIRLIATSHVYQLSSQPNATNSGDNQNYSRAYRSRLRAEVVADALSDITGVPDEFAAMPGESRATQIWTHRIGSLTLDTFGRPDLNQDPPCERITEPSATQALHLTNSEQVHRKIKHDQGLAAQLAADEASDDEVANEIYLRCFSRYPRPEELDLARRWFERAEGSRQEAIEDYLWAAINTAEFLFRN